MKSPFRYPGGKTKIASKIVDKIIGKNPDVFVDVFVGGGSVFLEWIDRNLTSKIQVNDKDYYVFGFWETIISGQVNEIVKLINKYGTPTVEKFEEIKSMNNQDPAVRGFQAIFLNRTTFSGISSAGPIGGYEQNGKYKISARYNQSKLIKTIQDISSKLKNRSVACSSFDFRDVIDLYKEKNALLYLDPPYMKQGHMLYPYYLQKQDYQDMATMLKGAKCDWIVSHDDHEDFVELFKGWSNVFEMNDIPYSINSRRNYRKTELLISNMDMEYDKRLINIFEEA